MGDESYIQAVTYSLPGSKPRPQPSSAAWSSPRRAVGRAEAPSRAMHEVRRSILRKLAPHFRKSNRLSSPTE
jgi:hypothetical protein